MDFSLEKWLVMALLAVISTVLGLIPYVVLGRGSKIHSSTTTAVPSTQSLQYKIILTILSTFGGGVLLSTAIIHMLTEAREELAHIPEIWETLESDFPLAEIITLVGFILIYFVEEIAHFVMTQEDQPRHSVARHNSIAHSINLPERKHSHMSSSDANGNVLNLPDLPKESQFEDEEDPKKGIGTTVRSFLALIALSFHAIMEGVAIGVQDSTDVWFMFGAVASHKFVISFCMGMELFATKVKFRTYLSSIVFFAIVSPIGIIIGSAITEGTTNTLPIAIIKGLSTGTLLYVVFFEIINRERERKSNGDFETYSRIIGFIQLISLTIGMVAMTVLIVTAGHHHSEDEGSSTDHPGDDHHDHGLFHSNDPTSATPTYRFGFPVDASEYRRFKYDFNFPTIPK